MGQGASSMFSDSPSTMTKSTSSSSSHRRTKRRHRRKSDSLASSSSHSRTHKRKSHGVFSKMAKELKHLDEKLVNQRISDGEIVKGFYKEIDGSVFYRGRPVHDTRTPIRNFVELGNRWAKDRFDVYYAGEIVKGPSSNTFKLLGGKYAGDAFNVYYGDRKTRMSARKFKYLGKGYAKDTYGNVYYKGKRSNKSSF